jgi:hypothetical protein
MCTERQCICMPEDVKIYSLYTPPSQFVADVDDSDEEQDEDSYSESWVDAYMADLHATSAAVPPTPQPSEIAFTPSIRCPQVPLTVSFQHALENTNSPSFSTRTDMLDPNIDSYIICVCEGSILCITQQNHPDQPEYLHIPLLLRADTAAEAELKLHHNFTRMPL